MVIVSYKQSHLVSRLIAFRTENSETRMKLIDPDVDRSLILIPFSHVRRDFFLETFWSCYSCVFWSLPI